MSVYGPALVVLPLSDVFTPGNFSLKEMIAIAALNYIFKHVKIFSPFFFTTLLPGFMLFFVFFGSLMGIELLAPLVEGSTIVA